MKNLAIKAVRKVGKILKENYGKIRELRIKHGNWHEVVTNVDMEANKILLETIKNKFPDHNIISEESQQKQTNSAYTWYIDPLDGTTNYTMCVPFFGVGVGLVFRNKVKLGVFYNPITNELFVAEKDKGATLNGEPIHVSKNTNLKNTVVNYCHINSAKGIAEIYKFFSKFKIAARDFRRLGSGGLDFCYLACGRNDVYLRPDMVLYDVIPGYIIAKEAGARITDWESKPFSLQSKNLLATNGKLHGKVLKILRG
jgi:myo-inositol-1(or 4)-monophosphatase